MGFDVMLAALAAATVVFSMLASYARGHSDAQEEGGSYIGHFSSARLPRRQTPPAQAGENVTTPPAQAAENVTTVTATAE